MRRLLEHAGTGRPSASGGYLVVLFVIIVAFVGVAASMQVLVLASVAGTSRAYDSYRQGSIELRRLEEAVTETVLDECGIKVPQPRFSIADTLTRYLDEISPDGTVSALAVPTGLPVPATFPDATRSVEPLGLVPSDLKAALTPELAYMAGAHVAVYPEATFTFATRRTVFGQERAFNASVRARVLAVPLTRFPVAAYELPFEIAAPANSPVSGPSSTLPAGLVPARDVAFVRDLQAQPGALCYQFRNRAATAAAYQYVFSQPFIDRVSEYAGITHYCDLSSSAGTAELVGMTRSGSTSRWDLGRAGAGSYGTITLTTDAAVLYAEEAGRTLQLFDSIGDGSGWPLLLLLLGPSDRSAGPLIVDVSSIARPFVLIGYNVRVVAGTGVSLNGAFFLDPVSSMAPAGPITMAHLSYWAGSTAIPEAAVVATGELPPQAEAIAPRVVYVATTASRP